MEKRIMSRIDDLRADESALKTAISGLVTAVNNATATIQQLKDANAGNDALNAQLDQLHSDLQADVATATAALAPDTVEPGPSSPVADTSAEPLATV
jgi:uncharacterized phage infection (PIP) family protein YhgE